MERLACHKDACARRRPHAAHIVPRSHRASRHDPANGITLCRRHHEFFHDHPKQFAAFVEEYLPRP
jgi:hypothetical protein